MGGSGGALGRLVGDEEVKLLLRRRLLLDREEESGLVRGDLRSDDGGNGDDNDPLLDGSFDESDLDLDLCAPPLDECRRSLVGLGRDGEVISSSCFVVSPGTLNASPQSANISNASFIDWERTLFVLIGGSTSVMVAEASS